MPTEATYKVSINVPREKAWEILQDITVPHKYVPGLIKTQMHTEQLQGVGASRRVFKKMMAMDETITEWNEGYGFTIRLHDGAKDKPFPKSYFIYAIADGSNHTTEFTATMGYSFPFGAIGNIINKFLIYPIVKGEIRAVALAVKYYYETGKTPTSADIKQLKKVC
jgi:hypothetical protein